jgi:CheY-like chemotaxis protein
MISIFLIDDDPIYLMLAGKIVSSADDRYVITEFMRAEEAMAFLMENKKNAGVLPDVILVDLSMPVMDGWSFLEQYDRLATEMAKVIPVYIVTSSISPEDIGRSKNYASVKDYFVKPLEKRKMQEIAAGIENVKKK